MGLDIKTSCSGERTAQYRPEIDSSGSGQSDTGQARGDRRERGSRHESGSPRYYCDGTNCKISSQFGPCGPRFVRFACSDGCLAALIGVVSPNKRHRYCNGTPHTSKNATPIHVPVPKN